MNIHKPSMPKVTEDRRGWHIDRGVSISTIITILITSVSILVWALSVEKRVELTHYIVVEVAQTQKEMITREVEQREKYSDGLRELRSDIRELKR